MRQFMKLEEKLGRVDLIFPVYYIRCPILETDAQPPTEIADVVDVLRERQRMRWVDLRRASLTSRAAMESIDKAAEALVDAMSRSSTPANGDLDSEPSGPKPSAGSDDEDEEGEGILDHLAGIDDYISELSERIILVGQLLGEIAETSSEYGTKVANADSSAKRISIFHAYSKAVDGRVEQLEATCDEYEDLLQRVDSAMTGILSEDISPWLETEDDRESYYGLLDQVAALPGSVEAPMESLEELARTTQRVAGLSKVIRPTMKRITAATRRVVKSRDTFDAWRLLTVQARAQTLA